MGQYHAVQCLNFDAYKRWEEGAAAYGRERYTDCVMLTGKIMCSVLQVAP